MERVRWGMRSVMLCGTATLAVLSLSGCATKLTAADGATLLKAAHDNGCSGDVTLDVRGATGQLGGSASGQFTLNGKCVQIVPALAPAAGLTPGLVVAPTSAPAPPG